MTTINDLYFYRGELLDTAAEAAIQERPFYLQSSLDDINDQIRLLENVTDEAQAEYFRAYSDDPRTPEQIALDEWQAEASDVGYGKNGRPR